MRDIVSGIEDHARIAPASEQPRDRIHLLGVYGAFTLIATIVFGTLSFHPF